MSETFTVEIILPEKKLPSRDATLVNFSEPTGRVGVEARHAPIAVELAGGKLEIVLPNGTRELWNVAPGIFSFDANLARILTTEASLKQDGSNKILNGN